MRSGGTELLYVVDGANVPRRSFVYIDDSDIGKLLLQFDELLFGIGDGEILFYCSAVAEKSNVDNNSIDRNILFIGGL